jgi:plastocyanin
MRFARIVAGVACAVVAVAPAVSSAATKTVDIPGQFFQPATIRVLVGDTVVWTNSSNDRHSVTATSDSREQFTSSTRCRQTGLLGNNDCIKPGAYYAHTFNAPGTFTYYCVRHGIDAPYPNCGMCGQIRVVRRASGTIAPTTPASVSRSASASATSPSPSASASASLTSSSSPAAAGDDGNGTGTSPVLAIAGGAVVLLGGSGFFIYRSLIRR